MKFVHSISTVIGMLLFSCFQLSVKQVQSEIDSLVKRWVPDKRTDVCNLTLVKRRGEEMVLKGESLIPEAKAEVLRFLRSKGIFVIDSVRILPDTVRIRKNWGIVLLSVANLRSKPTHSSELVSQAIMGTPVRVLSEDDGWILVQTPDRYISWTNKSSVQQMSRAEINDWRNSDRLIYTGTSGTVFGDSKQTTVISDLVAGAIVIKKSEIKNVTLVILPDGRSGYVANLNWLKFVQWKDTVSLIGDNLISYGERFLGFSYLWGGTSSKAMDCSGFVKTVYFMNGIVLERDASQQIKHGVEVDIATGWGKLQKGDLLFFGSKEPCRITHVGMYIGDSELIHSSGCVRINSLDSNRTNYSYQLSSTLLGARRMIGSAPEQGNLPVRLHNWY